MQLQLCSKEVLLAYCNNQILFAITIKLLAITIELLAYLEQAVTITALLSLRDVHSSY